MSLLPARNVLDGTKSPAPTTSEMKTAQGAIYDFLSGKFGTDTAPVTIASAATVAIGAAACDQVTISGTVTITAFDNVAAGVRRKVLHSGASTLTHNATSLILPGGANITTAAGDSYDAISLGSGNWQVCSYQRANGTPISDLGIGQTLTDMSGSRASGVTYTNTTGRPIAVYISFFSNAAANLIARINGADVFKDGRNANTNAACSLIVPNGSTYAIVADAGTITITNWKELR